MGNYSQIIISLVLLINFKYKQTSFMLKIYFKYFRRKEHNYILLIARHVHSNIKESYQRSHRQIKNQTNYSIKDSQHNTKVFKNSVCEIEEYIVLCHNEKYTAFFYEGWYTNEPKRNYCIF